MTAVKIFMRQTPKGDRVTLQRLTVKAALSVWVIIDGDAVPELLQRYGMRSIPTLMLVHHGREIGRQAGTMPLPRLVAWAREHAHGVKV